MGRNGHKLPRIGLKARYKAVFKGGVYDQMVLHRPFEPAAVTGQVPSEIGSGRLAVNRYNRGQEMDTNRTRNTHFLSETASFSYL